MEDIEKILKIVNNQLKYTKDINEKVNLIRQVKNIMNEVEQVTKEFYDDLNDIKLGDKIVDKTYLICPVCGDRECIKTITTNYIFDGKDHKIGG